MPDTQALTKDDVLVGLGEIVEDVTGIWPDEITPEKKWVDDLDVDSLSMAGIVEDIETRYGFIVADDVFYGFKTVGEVVEYVLLGTGNAITV